MIAVPPLIRWQVDRSNRQTPGTYRLEARSCLLFVISRIPAVLRPTEFLNKRDLSGIQCRPTINASRIIFGSSSWVSSTAVTAKLWSSTHAQCLPSTIRNSFHTLLGHFTYHQCGIALCVRLGRECVMFWRQRNKIESQAERTVHVLVLAER